MKNILHSLFALLLTSTQFLTANPAVEAPPEVQAAHARFIQRMELDPALPKARDFGKDYLFQREGTCPGSKQIRRDSKSVYKVIKSEQLPVIKFNKQTLIPFDNYGTCSAMALDFAARYNTACANNPDPEARRQCVAGFGPYYANSNSTYMSRQAAYNTIEVKGHDFTEVQSNKALSDEIKRQKISSLANYHGLSLTPVTETIQTEDIKNGSVNLVEIVDNLPNGTYVVRMLHPGDNVKHEWYGHTMVFVKDDELAIYFDNATGATDMTDDSSQYVYEVLTHWYIPEFRIYHATCPEGGCRNFANDSCSVNW